MSKEHKRPLYAFVVLVLACSVVMAHGLRTEALQGFLRTPVAAVVAGTELTRINDPDRSPVRPATEVEAEAPAARTAAVATPAPVARVGALVDRPAKVRKHSGVTGSATSSRRRAVDRAAAAATRAPSVPAAVRAPSAVPVIPAAPVVPVPPGPGHGRAHAPGHVPGHAVAAAQSVVRAVAERLERSARSLSGAAHARPGRTAPARDRDIRRSHGRDHRSWSTRSSWPSSTRGDRRGHGHAHGHSYGRSLFGGRGHH